MLDTVTHEAPVEQTEALAKRAVKPYFDAAVAYMITQMHVTAEQIAALQNEFTGIYTAQNGYAADMEAAERAKPYANKAVAFFRPRMALQIMTPEQEASLRNAITQAPTRSM